MKVHDFSRSAREYEVNKVKVLKTITISIACILLIAVAIGFNKYNNMTNPYRAFVKDLPQETELQQRKSLQRRNELQLQNEVVNDDINSSLDNVMTTNNLLNILLLGVDSDDERESMRMGYRSDSIVVAALNLETKEVKMLSIPRDSYTDVPGNKNKDKINHAMAFGGGPKKKGNQYAVEAVENLLGIDIHYYITLDMDAVRIIVDTIGGVTIDVERDMGSSEKLLEKGKRKLNGDEALIYVRNRNVPEGDFARIEQQQRFMIALFQQTKESGKLSDMVSIYLKVQDKIFTNLNMEQIGALVLLSKDLDLENIETFTLKGKGIKVNGIYYLEIDKEHMEDIVNEHFI